MASQIPTEEIVTLEELAISNSFKIVALVSLLERKGLLTRDEILAEIKRICQS